MNQSRTVPEQPKVVCNLLVRIPWSTMSNAADRSRSDKRHMTTFRRLKEVNYNTEQGGFGPVAFLIS